MFYCSVIKVPVALTALIFYHISFSLSRTFSKSFFSYSAEPFFFFDSHTRLSHLHRFVKNFLKLFYRPKSSFCSLWQLNYITILFSSCQQYFTFFSPTSNTTVSISISEKQTWKLHKALYKHNDTKMQLLQSITFCIKEDNFFCLLLPKEHKRQFPEYLLLSHTAMQSLPFPFSARRLSAIVSYTSKPLKRYWKPKKFFLCEMQEFSW